MSADPPPAKEKKKERWRRPLKRLLWGLLGLLLLLGMFHRPLLRWGLNSLAPLVAKRAGYDLQWQVEGTVVSTLKVRNLKLLGPATSSLKSVECGELEADYSLWSLMRNGRANFLHTVKAADVQVTIDSRIKTPPKPKKNTKGLPDYWVEKLDLENINFTMLGDAGDIQLRGLSLHLDAGKPGEVGIEELVIPSSGVHLTSVHGKTLVKEHRVVFSGVDVSPGVQLSRLDLGLGELTRAAIPLQAELRSGEGTLKIDGRLENLDTRLTVQATAGLQRFSDTELGRWMKMPPNFTWRIDNLSLQLTGPPAAPQELTGAIFLDASSIRAAKINIDRGHAEASIAAGKLRLDTLTVQAAANKAELSGNAELPPTWKEMGKMSAEVQWKVDASQLDAFFPQPSEIAGNLHGSGTLALKEGHLGGAKGSLDGKQLRFRDWILDSIVAEATTDPKSLQIKTPASPRDLEGSLTINADGIRGSKVNIEHAHAETHATGGQLRLQTLSVQAGANKAEVSGAAALPATWAEMSKLSAEVQWKVDAPGIDAFFPAPSEMAGGVSGAGSVTLKEGQLGGATGRIDGTQLRFRQWSLESFMADVATDAESLQIKSLSARLGDQNAISLSGRMQLSGRQATDLALDIKFGDLAKVARNVGWQNPGAISAERFSGAGTAHFEVADLRKKNFRNLTAQGGLLMEGFAWGQRRAREVLLDFGMKTARAEVRKLDVVFDEQNEAHLTGSVQMEERQPLEAAWQVELGNFASMGPWIAWKPEMPLPRSGVFHAQGKANGTLADLKERRFAALKAEGTANLDGIVMGKARFDHAELNFAAREGRVELKQFDARFDERNHITAVGNAMLEKPGEFTGKVDAVLPQISSLSGWMEMFKAPAIIGGSANISWQGSGKIFAGEIHGNGEVKIADLKLADRPAFSVSLETQHEGKTAQISALRASTGNFRIEAEAKVSDTDLAIPKLTMFSGDDSLVNGSVAIPLALSRQPRPAVPLDASRPLNISLHAAKLELAKVFAAVGRKPPVTGTANADVELHGMLPELEGKIMLVLSDLRSQAVKGKFEPALLRVDGSLAQHRFSLKAAVDQKPLRTLTLTGEMPLDAEKVIHAPASVLDTEVEAQLVLPESDLSIVRRFVPSIAELRGTVSANVKVSGPLRSPHLAGALVATAPSATFEKTPMDIKNLKAKISFNDKHVKIDDVSAMLAGGELRATGGVDVTDIAAPIVDMQIVAHEALIVRNESLSARADGTLTCKGTLAKAEIAGRAELVRCRVFKEIEFLPLSLPNQLPPPPPPVTAKKAPSLPPPLSGWTFNVDIVTRDDIRLLGNVLNGDAKGNIHLGGTGAAPEMVGELTFDGARVRLPNSRLAITRGKLIFTKEHPFEPELDVQGESLVSNYEVILNASGSALKPKLRFTSSPPLSENEIAMLLATGALGGGENAAAGAAANTAAFMVLSKAYRSVFNKAAPKRYDDEPGRLHIGMGGEGGAGLSASYEISPHLQFSAATTERGTFRGMLYYMVRMR